MATFDNPVISGFYPDPSACRVGDDFYLVTSTFEYFPGVPIFHSRDLVNWRQIGHCLTRPSQVPLHRCKPSGGIFAPTLRYHPGRRRFYMVTTNTTSGGHFYVWADDPAGEWSEPVWVGLHGGIDPSLFFDDDGRTYFTSTGHEIARAPAGPVRALLQTEIDFDTGKAVGDTRGLWTGTGRAHLEGPHLYKIAGRYYLLASEGGTEYGHMVVVARAALPWGPFENCPYNPILSHRSTEHELQATGHAELIEATDGTWWAVFLAFRPVHYPPRHHLGRETCLAPVTWTADGWPVIGDGGIAPLRNAPIALPPHPWPDAPHRDDFDAPTLGLPWNHVRNPRPADYSLTDRPGWLTLRGSALTLDDQGSPTYVARRQQHFYARVETLMAFAPARAGEEAGLAVRYDEQHHYDFVVRTAEVGDGREAIVRCRVGMLNPIVGRVPLPPTEDVRLRIEAAPFTYTFSAATDGGEFQRVAEAETRLLSKEVAGGFTGVYVGPYATGTGQPATVPATFDWFDYVPLPDDGKRTTW
ncbi:MAG TPA: glycoside hydrolase family 43 protein [Tepidisphaeraceae bacterium]|nr:glycoside hydrolase family 43 protein [Tepidisphaeraceae bacterium]